MMSLKLLMLVKSRFPLSKHVVQYSIYSFVFERARRVWTTIAPRVPVMSGRPSSTDAAISILLGLGFDVNRR